MTKEEYKEYFFTINEWYVRNGLIDVDRIIHNDETIWLLPRTEDGYIDEQFSAEEWRELNLEYERRRKEHLNKIICG